MDNTDRKAVIAVVLGTRPEAIKMIPVINELRKIDSVKTVTISTGQHREMLMPILDKFRIGIDCEMDLMTPDQSLYGLSAAAIKSFEKVLSNCRPSLVLVQGDTTTAFLGALCAFYGKIPVGHVEAGLRTNNKYSPFPEEINRRLITQIADLNFAPTESNRQNLLNEGVKPQSIFVTGNTGIDMLLLALEIKNTFEFSNIDLTGKRLVLVTTHRRESFGKAMENIFRALCDLAEKYPDIIIVYPLHLNPNVLAPAHKILDNVKNIHLTQPVDYFDFVNLMKRACLILTDSGGIQEEAPMLGTPVLVLRNETERTEAVSLGNACIAGTSREKIVGEASLILDNTQKRPDKTCPYWKGNAATLIVKQVVDYLKLI
jgi:UDP-N-acetylglucosamine 2-epimerase (non-hydrolysing)